MQTGMGIFNGSPACVRLPVAGSMRKTMIESESWFSASRYVPVGAIAKLRILSQSGLMSGGRELAGGGIDREDRNAIVAAI